MKPEGQPNIRARDYGLIFLTKSVPITHTKNVKAKYDSWGLQYREAARLCGIAPGAPVGGCDPPQPTVNAKIVAQMM